MHVARERPWWRDGDAGIFDALVEEVGIFDKGGDEFTVFYFDDRVLSQESAARAKFEIVLEQYKKCVRFIVVCGERLNELVGDVDLFFGVGFEREEL